MSVGKRVCKICGKEYPYCEAMFKLKGKFIWQNVACCKEHGEEYFKMVLAARGEIAEVEPVNEAVEVPAPKRTRRKKPVEQ